MNENSQLYDNAITRYKKELWDLCYSMNIFNNISELNFDKAKEVFENVVLNHQAQILQQDNDSMLKQKIITEINLEILKLKEVTPNEENKVKKSQLDLQLDEKQKEFDSLMTKNVPETPDFNDKKEEPLEKENLEVLIQKQMEEREQAMNINPNTENKVVGSNIYTNNTPPQKILQTGTQTMLQTDELMKKMEIIENQVQNLITDVKMQSNILKQIVQSQITILNKLK